MSKYEIVRSLKKEIKKINYVIDEKIIQGLPYYNESRRHKFLTAQLRRLEPVTMGWFSRAGSVMSMFMF